MTRLAGTLLALSMAAVLLTGCSRAVPPPDGRRAAAIIVPDPEDPASLAAWQQSEYNVSRARLAWFESRHLAGSLAESGGPSRKMLIHFCGALEPGLSDEQERTLVWLLENERRIFQQARTAVYEYYRQHYHAWREGAEMGRRLYGGGPVEEMLPPIVRGDEIDGLVQLETIYVARSPESPCRIGLEFSCEWDEEHGIGVVIGGDPPEVLEVDTAHVAYVWEPRAAAVRPSGHFDRRDANIDGGRATCAHADPWPSQTGARPMKLELNDAERELLLDVLRDRLGTLREQVHHSMTSTFTDQLKDIEERMRQIIARLEAGATE